MMSLAVALKDNLNRWTKSYNSLLTDQLNEQNPILVQKQINCRGNVNLSNYNFVDFIFKFDRNLFT